MVKLCKKCNLEYSDSHKFCNNCGKKLIDKDKPSRRQLHISKAFIWIITILLVLLVISSIVIFAVQFPYTATEEYIEKEPYEATESFTQKEPYTDTECKTMNFLYKIDYGTATNPCLQQECASYNSNCAETNFWGNCVRYAQVCSSYKCVKYSMNCNIKIKNQEREGTIFNLDLMKYNSDTKSSASITKENVFVNALDEQQVNWNFVYLPTESVNCFYNLLSVPTRKECQEVTKFNEQTKNRAITKYKDVTKQRSVTKYATLFNQWTGKAKTYFKV